jgi:hypothetical protein
MRRSIASYGIIKHSFGDTDKYLLQYNTGWKAYNFISGHVEAEDQGDFEKTIIRELEEELPPIRYNKDFTVSPISDEPFQDRAYSLKARAETEYTFYLFFVKFLLPFDQLSFLWENRGGLNKWFSPNELKSGELKADGLKSGKETDIDRAVISPFPIPQIMDWIPGGLNSLPESF